MQFDIEFLGIGAFWLLFYVTGVSYIMPNIFTFVRKTFFACVAISVLNWTGKLVNKSRIAS